MISEVKESKSNNKGGRPKKQIKRDQLVEKFIITYKAKKTNLSASEYLRTLGIEGQVDRKIKTLPKEVLEFIGKLNHMAANLNQVAKKNGKH